MNLWPAYSTFVFPTDRWNNRKADRQAEKAFLEQHKGPGKFSGKYWPQPTETEVTELVWTLETALGLLARIQ